MKKSLIIQKKLREIKDSLSNAVTYKEITEKLLNIHEKFKVPIRWITIPKGTILYRSRIIDDISNLKDWEKGDFWEVPANLVTSQGRVNLKGESVFYLSDNVLQTLVELRYEYDTPIVSSAYRLDRNISVVKIGEAFPDEMLKNEALQLDDDDDLIASNMIADFFNDIFSAPVGKGTEYLYIFSNAVVKNFYDHPMEVSQGWAYSAVQNQKSTNVALKNGVAGKYLKYEGSICLMPYDGNKFSIPLCFNDKYKLVVNDDDLNKKWITDTFNLTY